MKINKPFIGLVFLFIAILFLSSGCSEDPVPADQDDPPVTNQSAPVLSISSPLNNQILTNTNFIVSGVSSGSNSLVAVYFAVDSGSFAKVSGTSSWTTNLVLPDGSYILKAYATDISNLSSPVVSINIEVDATTNGVTNDDTPAMDGSITNNTTIL